MDKLKASSTPDVTSQRVTFEGPHGMQIVAYIDEGPKEDWNGKFILLAPRYGESKKNNLQLSYVLASNHFKVMRFDHTNHIGESDGTMEWFTIHGAAEDIIACANHLDMYYEPKEIALVSLSLSCRSGLRACARGCPISRFVSVVGMVDLGKTLNAIYDRDMLKAYSEEKWERVDILGFDINGANFYDSLFRENLQDLSGAIEDAKKTSVPLLHLHAENDKWVDSNDVEELISHCPKGQLEFVSGVAHEINENRDAFANVIARIIAFCAGVESGPVRQPEKRCLMKQNKAEREALQKMFSFNQSEAEFWGDYLSKFGIIEEAEFYVEYFKNMSELLGAVRPGDTVLDAGCGNGFFGLSLLHSAANQIAPGGPIYYCALDLSHDGLATSYRRHVSEYSRLMQMSLRASGIGMTYSRVNLDGSEQEEDYQLHCRDGSFSKICSSLVVSYLKDPSWLFREIFRLLKPGGVAIVSSMKPGCDMTVLYHESITQKHTSNRESGGRALLSAAGKIKLKKDSGIYHFFSRADLQRAAFDAGFTDISAHRSFGNQANVVRLVK
ncbi:MAG: methyltransferase domain-containing protein [Verrucomicrobiota bacterium]